MGRFVITDLDSKNGTFVNGEKITERALADGDEVVFGTIKTIFKNPQEFNIDDISRSMLAEEKPPVVVENGTPAMLAHDSENPPPESAPSDEKPAVVTTTPEVKTKKQDQPELQAQGAATPRVESPVTAESMSLFKSLSVADTALFGFGILVLILIITMLMMVLK